MKFATDVPADNFVDCFLKERATQRSSVGDKADLAQFWLERVSKIDSASHQILTCEAGCGLSFCHEEAAEAVDGRAVGAD